MKKNDEKAILEQLIIQFLNNAIKIKHNDPNTNQYQLKGGYLGLDVKASFGLGGFYANVPWISFLSYKQRMQEGIYPIILYTLASDKNNFEVCYGISEKFYPDINWPQTIIKDKQKSKSIRFSKSFLHKSFTINNIEDFEKNKQEIFESINEVISSYKMIFQKK